VIVLPWILTSFNGLMNSISNIINKLIIINKKKYN
jgi:hypothetical protein